MTLRIGMKDPPPPPVRGGLKTGNGMLKQGVEAKGRIMNEISLGNLIKKERESQGLSQEQLCEGVCEPVTLSRLETGKSIPAMHRLRALLQKLGLPEERAYVLLGKNEIEIAELEREINKLHVRFEQAPLSDRPAIRAEAEEKHGELERLAGKDDRLVQQMILRSKFVLGKEDGPYGLEEGMALLLKAIRLTSPNFRLNRISLGLYSENEIRLINSMATLNAENGDPHEAVDILKQLFAYLKASTKLAPGVRALIPMVAFNYSRELCAIERYDKAIEIAEYGKSLCVEWGYYLFLPDLLAVLAECYFYKNEPRKSAELYQDAYVLYKVIGNDHDRKTIQTEAKERLGLELDRLLFESS